MTKMIRLRVLLAGLAAALAAACGGGADSLLAGVGSGGTGGGTPTTALGAISGFSSVIVNGVRFDDTSAVVVDDEGRGLTSGQLRLGMVVLIDGKSDSTGVAGVASTIEAISELRGPVQSVGTGSFNVLGVTVTVSQSSVFDGFTTLAQIVPGAQVEVSGFLDEVDGHVGATRIELLSGAPASFKARGLVGAVNGEARTMQFGTLAVDYSAATLIGLPGGPQTGAVVKLLSSVAPQPGKPWRVERMELVRSPVLQESSKASLEGRISDFASLASFSVQGVRIDASSARLIGGTAAALADGVRVEVKGVVSAGALKATEVEIEDEESHALEFEVEGSITAVNGPMLFVVRNTLIDASQAQLENGGVSDIRVGARVHAKGTSVGGVLQAERVEFEK